MRLRAIVIALMIACLGAVGAGLSILLAEMPSLRQQVFTLQRLSYGDIRNSLLTGVPETCRLVVERRGREGRGDINLIVVFGSHSESSSAAMRTWVNAACQAPNARRIILSVVDVDNEAPARDVIGSLDRSVVGYRLLTVEYQERFELSTGVSLITTGVVMSDAGASCTVVGSVSATSASECLGRVTSRPGGVNRFQTVASYPTEAGGLEPVRGR